jgi:hypothetical protein
VKLTSSVGVKDVSSENPNQICVNLSKTLISKIKSQADTEGLSLSDFVEELLTESVVMRAYEIAERRAAQKTDGASGGNNPQFNQRGNGGFRGQGNNQNQRQGGNGSKFNKRNHQKYQHVMEDNASFLEYVRNQEP